MKKNKDVKIEFHTITQRMWKNTKEPEVLLPFFDLMEVILFLKKQTAME